MTPMDGHPRFAGTALLHERPLAHPVDFVA